ncbi:MAG: T9SS type A sorting domain-containing protein [Bacteroidetes bacterium]|nr:T9SS type A sorting domain-containing protein [Bacteroidota bacterium]MBS1972832.1 T9SS type A sorting domain-containing protein [Bacteroidota bacterium]
MKSLYPIFKKKFPATYRQVILTVALSMVTILSFSQGLVFRDPVLESGVDKSDGAVYRFSNVTTNVDALLTINGRSSSLVTLDTVDVTSTGWDKAFQPVVTYNSKNAKGPVSWWMEFVVTFVQSGTSTPVVQDTLNATAIDIDGDGVCLQEQFYAYGSASYTVNTPCGLTASSITGGKMFTGPITNSVGIDTSNTKVMVTLTYNNVGSIKFRYGGTIQNSGSSNAANRYNSIWFKTFQYTGAKTGTLPIELTSFLAQLTTDETKVNLNWSTSAEINASHFIIQRSTDGTNYEDVAMIFTQEGNSSSLRQYNYSDNISSVKSALVFYRLAMVDIDGNSKLSDVKLVKLGNENQSLNILVYPNPAHSELRITVPGSWQGKSIWFLVYNANGMVVQQKISSNAGQTELLNIADLPTGIYVVKAANGNEFSTKRIVKLN